jgi:oligopeptide/dipeptide ABC transporter ATP-binding protein
VGLPTAAGEVELLRGVDLELAAGETLAVVGESGSGKSLTVLSVMGLLSAPLRVTSGSVDFDGVRISELSESRMRQVRGRDIAMVYQDPMTSLNPFHRIGDQISEAMTAHGQTASVADARTRELLAKVGIPDPERAARAFPHEMSGGMRQRVVIAMALAMGPRLLVADEPTTALDVTIQQQILALVAGLRRELGMATIWVTHDLGVVARLVDRVAVMYAGRIVEDAPVRQLFADPQHPYTARLLASLPKQDDQERGPLAQIPGRPPRPGTLGAGCSFAPRCPQRQAVCEVEPVLEERGPARVACHVPPAEWVEVTTAGRADGR